MKTKKIISVLRAAVERAALLMVTLVVIVFAMQKYTLCNFAQNHWYIGAAVLIGYVALTYGEDYLNRRILSRGR